MRTWQLPQDMEPGVGEMFAQCPTVWVSSQSQLCSTRKSRKNQETVKNPHQFQPLSTTGEWYVCVQPVYWHDQAYGSYMVPITVDPIPEKTRPRDGWGECSPLLRWPRKYRWGTSCSTLMVTSLFFDGTISIFVPGLAEFLDVALRCHVAGLGGRWDEWSGSSTGS